MFDHIVIAVDGTVPANRATEHGASIAAAYDAHVEVVHVLEEPTLEPRGREQNPRHRGQDIVEEATETIGAAGVRADTILLDGRPPRAIAEHASQVGADLIVMGRHGRSGAGERLLGTVTERVLRSVDLPVLTAPATDTTPEYGGVLVPTDGSESAHRAVPYAESLAVTYGATLHALHVVDVQGAAGVFDAGGVSTEFVDRLETRGREAVDRVMADVDSGVAVQDAVIRGTAHTGIREYAMDNGVDLIVMGSTGASELAGQTLGSVANRVLRTTSLPVLIVPE